jgi:EpsI family protein
LNVLLLLAVLGSHAARRIESATVASPDFLKQANLQFRNWKTADSNLSPAELTTLQPDASLVRMYQSPGEPEIELAVIAGHRKKSIHTPDTCLQSTGWETLSQRHADFSITGRTVHAMKEVKEADGRRLLVTYLFTDGEYSTPSLASYQTEQLLKRFKSRVPVGALVRISVMLGGDDSATEKLSDEFAAAILPGVMSALRSAHLNVP